MSMKLHWISTLIHSIHLKTLSFLCLWIIFFAAGLVIDTEPYRQGLAFQTSTTWSSKVSSSFVVLICYTPTNVAILCCLAGLLGALGSQVKLEPGSAPHEGLDKTHPLLSALIRGFFVYIVLISGTLILLPDPFPDPSIFGSLAPHDKSNIRELYIRLAGLVSLVSFVVSYNPKIFATGLKKIIGATETKTD